MNKTIRQVLAVVALGGAMSAQAAVTYTGSWDPPFGSLLPNLGWSGEFKVKWDRINPSAACDGPGSFVNGLSGCYYAYFTSVNVKLFDLDNVGWVELLNTGALLGEARQPIITQIDLNAAGQAYEFDSLWSNWMRADANSGGSTRYIKTAGAAGDPARAWFSVRFQDGDAQLCFGGNGNRPSVLPPTNCSPGNLNDGLGFPAVLTIRDELGNVVTATVPAPGSLLLAGLALAGVGIASRRRNGVSRTAA